MVADYERLRAARLAAYRRQGIDLTTSTSDQLWEASGWDREWLYQRLLGPDHIRIMVQDGTRIVGVMTQPYRTSLDEGEAKKLADLVSAGFAVDLCPPCSPHYPGHTVAFIHYRPDGDPSRLHLPPRLHVVPR